MKNKLYKNKLRNIFSIMLFVIIVANLKAQKHNAITGNLQTHFTNSFLYNKNDIIKHSPSLSLAYKPISNYNLFVPNQTNYISGYKPWESEKHFFIAVGELTLVQIIPWAFTHYITEFEDPSDDFSIIGLQSWWQNLEQGWEYDRDNFLTNNFAHPYHGSLYFNVGRTNGYSFWESVGWSLAGSTMWEFFGENNRPAINDWIYTGLGGVTLGEITYKLSHMITDNTATGFERTISEIFGALVNPARGFNRLISGETGKVFPNTKLHKPDDFLISFSSGTVALDKTGDKKYSSKEIDGVFELELSYGNLFKAKKPFDHFLLSTSISSGLPHFTSLNTSGFLFGRELIKNKHFLNLSLNLNYINLIQEVISLPDTTFKGFLYGSTRLYPHILSKFSLSQNTHLITSIGVTAVLMGATPNDYFRDPVEGRAYDMGPGLGSNIMLALKHKNWEYLKLVLFGNWIWTQSEPSGSKHNINFSLLTIQYPLNDYFAFGLTTGIYLRYSYYDDHPDVEKNHPVLRVFFKTKLLN
ncbi:MAG: DUF3943 domain-containing protein [Ignavibacteriae bacterium]|nr:DUF3943 domain-containing protein [Ignavibacteriota bacterium]NOG98790.1 DUF3943 domain-containing protein [Ignavibacteriota bacterium]